MKNKNKGFTLTEIVIALAVVTSITAVTVTVVNTSKSKADILVAKLGEVTSGLLSSKRDLSCFPEKLIGLSQPTAAEACRSTSKWQGPYIGTSAIYDEPTGNLRLDNIATGLQVKLEKVSTTQSSGVTKNSWQLTTVNLPSEIAEQTAPTCAKENYYRCKIDSSTKQLSWLVDGNTVLLGQAAAVGSPVTAFGNAKNSGFTLPSPISTIATAGPVTGTPVGSSFVPAMITSPTSLAGFTPTTVAQKGLPTAPGPKTFFSTTPVFPKSTSTSSSTLPPIDPNNVSLTTYQTAGYGYTDSGGYAVNTGWCGGSCYDLASVYIFFQGSPNWTSQYTYSQLLDAAFNRWNGVLTSGFFKGHTMNMVYGNLAKENFFLAKNTPNRTTAFFIGNMYSAIDYFWGASIGATIEPRHDQQYNGLTGDAYLLIPKPLCGTVGIVSASPPILNATCVDSYTPQDPRYPTSVIDYTAGYQYQ